VSSLPILQDGPKIKRSRAARWRAASLIGVHLLVAGHVAWWLATGRALTPVEPSEAMAFVKGGMVNAGLIFFAAAILLTAVFGRFFCGWACHVVALQDLSRWLLAKVGIRPRPLRSRLLRWVPAAAFAYMFLWPLAYRLWIGDSLRVTGTEFTTSAFWSTFPGWIVGGLTFVVCGFAAIYFLGAKGFCTYACPYGAIFAAAERLSPLRIRVTDACQGCGHCTAVCTSNVRVHEEVRDFGMVVDSGCMKCQDCVSVCPNDALYYGFGPIPLRATRRTAKPAPRRYPLARWEEALLAVAFAAAFFSFRDLYGAVPFLMALGLAGVLAYLVLLCARLVRLPNVAGKRFPFKRGGRLLPAGWAFVGGMALLFALWVDSGVVRAETALGERGWSATADLRRTALDATVEPRPLAGADRAAVLAARRHLRRVERWGLLPSRGVALRLSWLDLLAGATGELRADAARAVARGEEPATVYQLVARDAARRGETQIAMAAYEHAIAAAPESPEPYVALGVTLARAGDLAAARDVFDRGRARIGGSRELVYNAALIRALQGDSEGSIALFQQVLVVDPGYLEARENLAGVLAGAGRYAESVEQYRQALLQNPGDAGTRLLLARALAAWGRLDEAAGEVEQALKLDPDLEGARGLEAEIAARRERAGSEERNGR
jgi:Flp pilus assembly protein TadD/NAD-dependent dihydropyrimidine dehydrogenase PreA subunit